MKYRMQRIQILFLVFILSSFINSCNRKLDEDGGYYDETTQRYKYVRPTMGGLKKLSFNVVPPQPGMVQKINGKVSKIGDDAKSLWLTLEERRPYMILADSLANNNRNDKDKAIRISLEYVSPLGSVVRGKKFRQQWKRYVIKVLEEQLLNRKAFVDIRFDERARKFWGTVYKIVNTKEGEKLRNFNIWMVHAGLSYYFVDRGKSPLDAEYKKAQTAAENAKSGLWRYQ